MLTETKIGKTLLRLVTGDIADQDTDAVVTAAHWRLNKGAGTDGTIHIFVFFEMARTGSVNALPVLDNSFVA